MLCVPVKLGFVLTFVCEQIGFRKIFNSTLTQSAINPLSY